MLASYARVMVVFCVAFFSANAGAATRSSITIAPVGPSPEIPAALIKPDGERQFPAVVIMHDCSGLGARSSGAPLRWAADLKRAGFTAAIALYPSGAPRYGAWSTAKAGNFGPVTSYAGVYKPIAPLLILIGEQDDWTPAEPCRHLAERSRGAGYPVDIKIYPGAHHSFDSDRPVRYDGQRNNSNAPSGRGATTGGDATSWADAKKQVAAFFALHLKQKP